MLIDVEQPTLNLILSGCIYALVLLTLLSLVPWPLRGGRNRWTLLLPLLALVTAVLYEATMPIRMNIRIDLLLILPLLWLVLIAWVIRLVLVRRDNRRRVGQKPKV